MNLCIDQGNSRTKVAVFTDDGKLFNHFIYKSFSSDDAGKICDLYNIENSILSSVVNIEPAVLNTLQRKTKRFVVLDHSTPVPIRNAYDTPNTLGQDRLAAAVGANAIKPNQNLLIIDSGSAITYDFVSEDNTFVGGNIAPGMKMRFVALKNQTKKLPLVELGEKQLIPLFGKNTNDAILAGVVRGVKYEVEGYMRTLQKRVGNCTTFLTGGNAAYIMANVKLPMTFEKNLVLIGLNRILEYNLSL